MGTDKALLPAGGATLLEHIISTLRELSDDILVVGRSEGCADPEVRWLPDRRPGCGPLGGIETALLNAAHPFVLCVACDMPLLSPRLLRAMANVPRNYELLVPRLPSQVPSACGTYEMLHAIYSRRCLSAVQGRLDAGRLQLAGLLDAVVATTLDGAWLRSFDPDLRSFTNANTPDEWESIRKQLGDEKAGGRDGSDRGLDPLAGSR
jgi:molybdopterin-guanine dinucleotide biosynthesis protein A